MKKNRIFLATLVILLALLTGCSTSKESDSSVSYQTISGKEAKDMMDTDNSIIVLDVRTQEEYGDGHIPNSILIPYDQIEAQAPDNLPDKSATILVYCRSGRRSAIASQTLATLGYENIYDFGGINDWDYDVVK